MRCSRPGVPGHGPRPGQRLRVAQVGLEALGVGAELHRELRQLVERRDLPGLGAVGQVAVGEHDHRHHVLDARCGWPRARPRSSRRAWRPRAPASAPRSCGRRWPGSRSACSVLVGRPVEGPPRWMSQITSGSSVAMARPMASVFSAMPGPEVVVTREGAAVGRADRGGDGRDLVLGLERHHPELLVHRQLVQDVGGGRDRVAALEERQARPAAPRPRSPGRARCCR